jgi:hypothetical protein
LNANFHDATHAPEAQPSRLERNRFACKRMRRKEFASSNHEPNLLPHSWRETLLRTDYKNNDPPRAVSNVAAPKPVPQKPLWWCRSRMNPKPPSSMAAVDPCST